MRDERALGPEPGDGLVHRRQMMKVDHVDATEACPLEHALPRRHLSLRLLRAQSGEHRIGRPLPVLEGAVERNRPGQLILTALEARESGRVVRRLDVQPLEEGGGMRLLPRRAERPRGEHDLPPGLARARARDSGRPAPSRRADRT